MKFGEAVKFVGGTQADLEKLTATQKRFNREYGISGSEFKAANAELLRLTGNIGATQKLQQAMVDMSKGLDMDLTSTAEVINRALNNGLSALSRYGIKASDEMNAHWDQLGDDQEAKAAYLAELLEGKFAGSAAAFGNSTAGQLKRVQLQFNALKVELGQMLLPVMLAVANTASRLMKILGGLPGVLAAFGAAIVAVKVIQLAAMKESEVAALHGIAKWVAVGIAKAYAQNFFLGVAATAAIPAAVFGAIYGGTKLIQHFTADQKYQPDLSQNDGVNKNNTINKTSADNVNVNVKVEPKFTFDEVTQS